MNKKRNNKIVWLILLILSVSIHGYAQDYLQLISANYPDTITLEADNQNEVTFVFNRISRKKAYLTDDLWKSTLSIMENAAQNSSLEGGLKVSYRKVKKGEEEVAKVEVTPLAKENDVYIIAKGEVQEKKADRIEFILHYEQFATQFSVNTIQDLESIRSLDLSSLWAQIDEKFENEGKQNLYRGRGQINYGKATLDPIVGTPTGLDNLEITFIGLGLGYYRDRFVPDMGSKLSFNLKDRLGKDWIEFGALYTLQFFFQREAESDYQMDLNGWVTGFGKLTFGGGDEIGIGVGGLVHREGGYFKGTTMKLSLYSKQDNARFTFSPEVIFTNDFKQVFPALRFGMTF